MADGLGMPMSNFFGKNALPKSATDKQVRKVFDPERSQAKLRFVLGIPVVAYVFSMVFNGHLPIEFFVFTVLMASTIVGLFLHVVKHPEPNSNRILIGIFHDQIMMTFLLYFAGMQGAPLFFVFTFVTIGNGFRFGVKYLAISGGLAFIGISTLLLFSPHWSHERAIAAGLLINHVSITCYTGFLLRKLKAAQTKLEDMANMDILTGLPNRNSFINKIEATLIQSMREKNTMACIYFDLDGFKAVNDTYGHACGDSVLKTVAESVRAVLRSDDYFSRLGGDEFTIIASTLGSPQEAEKLAARVIRTIESIKNINGNNVCISASIGIVLLSGSEASPAVDSKYVIKAADEAMYRAKRKGKGRYELSDFIEAPSSQAA